MPNFTNLFDKVLHMFWTGPLSIIKSISTMYTRNRYHICHASSVGCLLAWSERPDHASRQPTELAWQMPIACIQCRNTPDDGQWTCAKHVDYFIK